MLQQSFIIGCVICVADPEHSC